MSKIEEDRVRLAVHEEMNRLLGERPEGRQAFRFAAILGDRVADRPVIVSDLGSVDQIFELLESARVPDELHAQGGSKWGELVAVERGVRAAIDQHSTPGRFFFVVVVLALGLPLSIDVSTDLGDHPALIDELLRRTLEARVRRVALLDATGECERRSEPSGRRRVPSAARRRERTGRSTTSDPARVPPVARWARMSGTVPWSCQHPDGSG